jgi:tRNA(Glu) U13 pseudouridine synthase TruD
LILSFEFPRGSYATLIVKRVQQAAPMASAGESSAEQSLSGTRG